MKVASCIKNYITYMDEHKHDLFMKAIFPKTSFMKPLDIPTIAKNKTIIPKTISIVDIKKLGDHRCPFHNCSFVSGYSLNHSLALVPCGIWLQILNENGQHFTVHFLLKGKRDHINEKFNCHVGCVAWPFGKIKVATPLIKD